MRQFFKQLHSLPALILGIPIALICFTGGILVFEKQITQWQNPALYHIENPAAQALPMATLLQNASAHMPKGKKISTVTIGDAHTPYMVSVQGVKKRWSINQYTGEMLGEQKRSAFFSTIIYLHRFFLDTPEKKGQMTAGKMFIGISTIAMVIILLSSLRLWWPKTVNGLKNRLSICTSKGWKRFLYDAHVAGGFYVIILLLLMCLTGLVWSFTWYREALYALITSPERELMVKEIAQAAYTKTTVVGFEGLRIVDSQADLPWSVGKLMHVLHYGTWAGVFSQILYFIAMIVGTALPLSGYWFWYKKKRGKKKHDATKSPNEPKLESLNSWKYF